MSLPLSRGLFLLALLSACGDKAPVDPGDDTGTGPVDDTGPDPESEDLDGDGWSEDQGDCDDGDESLHPSAEELCNGLDDDCNGAIDEGFEDQDGDETPDCLDVEECDGIDNDGDGLIDEDAPDTDEDGIPDCGEVEVCDGLDNNGDGMVDEGFDLDGDGYLDCAGEYRDCDDSDADISPDAEEIDDDGIDNDCDGNVDGQTWGEGTLLITEIMNNPREVADNKGEWFEILNLGTDTVSLNGLLITSSDGLEEHRIISSVALEIGPGEYRVLGNNGDPTSNGGIDIDYVYSGIILSNEVDDLALYSEDIEIDRVAWDDGDRFPDPDGASLSLDPNYLNVADNDEGGVWCDAIDERGLGQDNASPGGENGFCPDIDRDFDGFSPSEGDCADADPDVNPGMAEVEYDGIDNDCDPLTLDDDLDEDGYDLADDCDDENAGVNPGETEVCDDDNLDEDCSGLADDDDPNVDPDSMSTWYTEIDGDGYASATGASVDACEPQGSSSGLDVGDCDDNDASVYPGATETAYNGTDEDCDGADRTDVDHDGFAADSVGGTDCDDTNSHVHPYAYEDTSDGIDNDCDGLTDTADTDTYTSYSLSDDGSTSVSLSGMTFPFCGTTYSTIYINSNGRVSFGSSATTYTESASSHASTRAIAAVWDDLNPTLGGTISFRQFDDAAVVYFRSVREYGSTSTNTVTFTVVMREDGFVLVDYGTVQVTDGLAGWSCGSGGSVTADDLTTLVDDLTDPAQGIGQGTENYIYELFTSNDTSGETIPYCVQLGDDNDGDGWTDECGDADDTDASVYPD